MLPVIMYLFEHWDQMEYPFCLFTTDNFYDENMVWDTYFLTYGYGSFDHFDEMFYREFESDTRVDRKALLNY